MIEIKKPKTASEYEEMKEEETTLVLFCTNWCRPALISKNTISKLAQDYQGKINIISADVDIPEINEIARSIGVKGIPTYAILKNKKKPLLKKGLLSKKELLLLL